VHRVGLLYKYNSRCTVNQTYNLTIHLSTFLRVQILVALTYLPDRILSYGSKFPLISVHFLIQQPSVTARCLMRFDTVENESSNLNPIQCKPICSPNHTARQTEAQGSMKKVQVRLQGHTVCSRYLRGGITLTRSYASSY
jgi:hypothetical protein